MSALREYAGRGGDTKRLMVLREVVSFDSQKTGDKLFAAPHGARASDSCILHVVANNPDELLAQGY